MKEFFANISIDLAKVGIILYLLGLFTSAFYFSRYGILALDFAKPQSVVIGTYILLLFGALPASLLFLLKGFRWHILQVATFCLSLFVINACLTRLLCYSLSKTLLISLMTSILELMLFARLSSVLESIRHKKFALTLQAIPPRPKIIAFMVIFSIHFSFFFFPFIPSYLAGGEPFEVQVFPKTADLPASRFDDCKNKPKINKSIDSFKLRLIYESDKDLYFIREYNKDFSLEGHSVMRLKRDEILRIDYYTPNWVSFEGEAE